MNRLVIGGTGSGKTRFVQEKVKNMSNNILLIKENVKGLDISFETNKTKLLDIEVTLDGIDKNYHQNIIDKFILKSNEKWDVIIDGWYDYEVINRIACASNCNLTLIKQDLSDIKNTLLDEFREIIAFYTPSIQTAEMISELSEKSLDHCISIQQLFNLKKGEAYIIDRSSNKIGFINNSSIETKYA